MSTRPVTVTVPTTTNATAAKRTLFNIALSVAAVGSVLVSVILLFQGGLALGELRYFIDIGQHPLHITSLVILILGLFAILAFAILSFGLIKSNRTFALIASGILTFVSIGLIILSIWSFTTLAIGNLPKSINNTLVKELDQTQYNLASGNNLIVDNTLKMARLEKQHQCCGLSEPIEDYRSRQPSVSSSSSGSGGGNVRGRPQSGSQKHAAASILLPISCCNEKYRSNDNNLCLDIYGNNSNPLNRYNNDGCFGIITREKIQHIKRQGFITISAGCLALISTIALVTVVKLLAQGYQVVPARTTTTTTSS